MATKPVTPMPSRDLETQVRQLTEQFCHAVNRRDPETLVQFYTPDAVLLPPNSPRAEGQDAIRRFAQSFFEAGCERLEARPDRIEPSDELVSVVGSYTMDIRQPDGTLRQQRGKYLEVHRRQPDGSLRLLFDSFSSDEPENRS